MSKRLLPGLLAALVLLGGCAEFEAWTSSVTGSSGPAVAPERGDPVYLEGVNTRADEVYVSSEAPAGIRELRNVYIAPANLANMQVIQPEGATADAEWWVTESEERILQQAIAIQFRIALSHQAAFNVVTSREQAEFIVNTAVVAIHPNETRSSVAAEGKPGGAITVSIALVNAASDKVMVRAVDTRSSEDIWAFNQVDNDDPAIDLIFSAMGNSIRRGMLQLQGRSDDPLTTPITLKEQQ